MHAELNRVVYGEVDYFDGQTIQRRKFPEEMPAGKHALLFSSRERGIEKAVINVKTIDIVRYMVRYLTDNHSSFIVMSQEHYDRSLEQVKREMGTAL